MREPLRDPDGDDVVRQRVLRALGPVVRKLDRVARHLEGFKDDHQRHACLALARLAPAVFGWSENNLSRDRIPRPHPAHSPEKAVRLMAELQALHDSSEPDEPDEYDRDVRVFDSRSTLSNLIHPGRES